MTTSNRRASTAGLAGFGAGAMLAAISLDLTAETARRSSWPSSVDLATLGTIAARRKDVATAVDDLEPALVEARRGNDKGALARITSALDDVRSDD